MGLGWASIIGIVDALPFALGLGVALFLVGETFPPGQRLAVSVLLILPAITSRKYSPPRGGEYLYERTAGSISVGVGTLLAMISASRYVADGKRFWLSWNVAEPLIWWP